MGVAATVKELQSHQNGYHVHRRSTMELKSAAEDMIRPIVNPVD